MSLEARFLIVPRHKDFGTVGGDYRCLPVADGLADGQVSLHRERQSHED